MKKRIVFAYNRHPEDAPVHFLFHKRGLSLGNGEKFGDPLCPLDNLDWSIPEVDRINRELPSVIMRFFMHPSIVARHSPKDYLVTSTNNLADISDSIVILHKTAVIASENLRFLKSRNNLLIFDMLDHEHERTLELLPALDAVIASSRKSYQLLRKMPGMNKPLFRVVHCTDTRLAPRGEDLPEFRPLCHGAPENAMLTPALRATMRVRFCYLEHTRRDIWLEETRNANFFYSVRPPEQMQRPRPFQKGFTAARLNSNMLIHCDDGDALHYLTDEYPYLIRGEINEEALLRQMRQAREDFGGPRWQRGLEIMAGLKDEFSDQTISAQFWALIESLG